MDSAYKGHLQVFHPEQILPNMKAVRPTRQVSSFFKTFGVSLASDSGSAELKYDHWNLNREILLHCK